MKIIWNIKLIFSNIIFMKTIEVAIDKRNIRIKFQIIKQLLEHH